MNYLSLVIVIGLLANVNCSIYDKYYKQAYEIAVAMTLDQKIGQTIQADLYSVASKNKTDTALISKHHLGSLLVGGDGCPDESGNMFIFTNQDQTKIVEVYANATLDKWQALTSKFANNTEKVTTNSGKTYEISLLLGTDAVHNDQHVVGNILFPHNIGMSCSHNPDNFYNAGKWTAQNVKKSGFNYAFAPTVAVSHNPQWGRFFETMGQDEEMIYKYAEAFTQGLQGKPGSLTGVLGSAKHYLGDGATMYGADEGNAHVGSFKSFLKRNSQGFNGSISADVGSVMCSYSAVNFLPMALSPLIQTHLRNQLNFDGFVIGDYSQLSKISEQTLPTDIMQNADNLNEIISLVLNAGTDMMMIPGRKDFIDYIDNVKMALTNKTISMDRLQDAVARIISVKLALGVAKLQSPSNIRFSEEENHAYQKPYQVQSATTEYEDSLKAVHESLVLLKNANVIPVKTSSLEYIVLVGERIININGLAKNELFASYNNIGMQSGGWSLRWQGFEGNKLWEGDSKKQSNASSILDALVNLNQGFQLVYPNYTTFTEVVRIDIERDEYLNHLKSLRKKMNSKNTLILAAVGESPYAEMAGDVGIPYCQNETILGKEGCLFDDIDGENPYYFSPQRASLETDFSKFDRDVIKNIREEDKNIPVLTVVFAGRPLHMDAIIQESSAVLDAFLPGTSGGQGVIDAITGSYIMRPNGQSDSVNSLSFDWPKNKDQLKKFPVYSADGSVPKYDEPLFKAGYGLSSFTG